MGVGGKASNRGGGGGRLVGGQKAVTSKGWMKGKGSSKRCI